MVKEFLNQVYFNNRILDYLIALAIFLVSVVAIIVLKNIIIKVLKSFTRKRDAQIDDHFVKTLRDKIQPFLTLLYFAAFYLGVSQLSIPPLLEKIVNISLASLLIFFGIRFLLSVLNYVVENYWIKRETDESRVMAIRGIETILKFLIWSIAIILLLDNFGVKVSALVAGLGIGGIAVALAAQSILGDLFSYFIIFFDRPFEIGDFINIDTYSGSIEHVGIKTTRIRSLSGEELVFSNTDLVNSRLRNYKRMNKRRISFSFGVIYQTSLEQLKEIPVIVTEIIKQIPKTTFDRVHFASYGDFSLNFDVVYYVNSRIYTEYMDVQQEINFKIKEEFQKRGIEFAYPTQTLFLTQEKDN